MTNIKLKEILGKIQATLNSNLHDAQMLVDISDMIDVYMGKEVTVAAIMKTRGFGACLDLLKGYGILTQEDEKKFLKIMRKVNINDNNND